MTVAANIRRAGPYLGTGSQTLFTFAFAVDSEDEIVVIQTDDTGLESTLTLDDDYTVTLNPDQGTAPGGTVTATTAPPSGEYITIVGTLELSQAVPLTNTGPFLPATVEAQLDRLTKLVQEARDLALQAVRVPRSAPLDDHQILGAALRDTRAGRPLFFNSDGDGLTLGTADAEAAMAAISAYGESLLDDADASEALDTLGVSAYVQTILDDADAVAAKGTLVIESTPRVIGARGVNNTATPNTQFDMACDWVTLVNPTTFLPVVKKAPATVTVNFSTSGPAANGRDQAGAFTAGSWVHLYYIWNGTTLAGIASATGPTTGPTLPSGYTHWAYFGTVRFNGSSQIPRCRIRGNRFTYDALVAAGSSLTSTSEANVSLTTVVPAEALNVAFGTDLIGTTDGSGSIAIQLDLLVLTGNTAYSQILGTVSGLGTSASVRVGGRGYVELPNVGQNVIYKITNTIGTSGSGTVIVHGFTLPNGG